MINRDISTEEEFHESTSELEDAIYLARKAGKPLDMLFAAADVADALLLAYHSAPGVFWSDEKRPLSNADLIEIARLILEQRSRSKFEGSDY